MNRWWYRLRSGKNSKFAYYLRAYLRQCTPSWWCRLKGCHYLQAINQHPDRDEIIRRINYYCQIDKPCALANNAPRLSEYTIPKKQKVYYFDAQEYTRYFDAQYRWHILPGDIVHIPEYPSIVKSRPLDKNNQNSILFKMDKVRHFIFVNDKQAFLDKRPKAIFRGKVEGKAEREQFMRLYFGSEECDCGDVSRSEHLPKEWQTYKLTIAEQLQYRYIMALEGNDVASNLKWIMSSSSIAIMPRPTCETWFMEGTLIPNYHYIEIQADFTDLPEKIAYYNAHPEEAQAIIQHANEYVAQFKDTYKEHLILMGVMDKYLRLCNESCC